MASDVRLPSASEIRARLRIRHLDLLRALDSTRSVHKAAAQMGMTQPAASKLLAELEATFGVPLFARSRRGVTPTRYGLALAHKAGLLLADLDGARVELEAMTRGASGRVRAGVLQVVLPVLIPEALAQLRKEAAGVTVMLQEGSYDVLLNGLARGELDCVIGRLMTGAAQRTFRTEILYEEPIRVVARIGHPLMRSSRVNAATLARQSWILPPPEAPLRARIDAYFAEQNAPLIDPVVESVSLLANEVLLRQSNVLAAMPRGVALHYARLGVLGILKFQPDWSLPPVGVVTRADAEIFPALQVFLEAVCGQARALRLAAQ
ncbi:MULTISPECIES: LysR substrate-binding domain-containing protein [unclassified Achromobacter]|uniref:LysR substrate-binding domain-containing protein n=1 Tax=unclassified Achromobacter TaxID=2626865 RepID=UPI00069F677E|nr:MULTISPECIES: LysR substrate-binding domain-containing protein [unclassified Achromobacter]KOF55142.1 LysR family transcriptional regulator [Achromobacter sp. DMS1]